MNEYTDLFNNMRVCLSMKWLIYIYYEKKK